MSLSNKTAWPMLLLCLFSHSILKAQSEEVVEEKPARVYIVDLGLELLFPNGSYLDQGAALEKGISGAAYFQMKPKSSVFMGVEISNHWLQNLNTDLIEFINGEAVEVNESFQTYTLDLLLSTRVFSSFKLGPFNPYGDVGLGMKTFYASWSQNSTDGTEISSFEFRDGNSSLQYGLSLGSVIHLSEQIFLNTKVKYLRSGTLNYKVVDKEASYTYPEDGFVNALSTMPTLGFYIGINWLL